MNSVHLRFVVGMFSMNDMMIIVLLPFLHFIKSVVVFFRAFVTYSVKYLVYLFND